MIKTLIVDDSKIIREFMIHLLSSDPEIQIVGTACNGNEAIDFVREKRPDVITMDVHMPVMDGYEATRIIMETNPTPIVVVSGSLKVSDVANSFKLFEAGALAVVLRPPGIEDAGYYDASKALINTVKLMSEIKVVKRFPKPTIDHHKPIVLNQPINNEIRNIQLIAIGASTGGPVVLQKILSELPEKIPVPVLIVQHIAKGFIQGFRDWLSNTSMIPLTIAKDGEQLYPGIGYIAPDDFQMGIASGLKIFLSNPLDSGLFSSVDFLFHSVAEILGPNAIGILLSGMGKDGAKELKSMRDKGAITIVQDEASCVVYGMPAEAVKLGAVNHILSPEKITEYLNERFPEVNELKTNKIYIP
jgi:two-component system chemotaxis response regulator CheB